MRMLVEPLGLKMPMAAFNGGMIVHPDLKVVDERPLPDDVVPEVIKTLLAHRLDVWIYRGTEWYIQSAQAPHVDREAATVQFPPTVVPTFDGLLNRVVKIVGVSDDLDSVARCEAAAQAQLGAQVSAARSQPYYLDVTHPMANKGTVIERLSQYLKIPLESDRHDGRPANDVLMFKRSGLSIAMGNASEEVKAGEFRNDFICRRGFCQCRGERFILHAQLWSRSNLERRGKGLMSMKATQCSMTSARASGSTTLRATCSTAARSQQYIDELSVTGLTSNPTIFDQAIKNSAAYDAGIREKLLDEASPARSCSSSSRSRTSRAPPTCFAPIYDRTNGVDGWVSLEVSPLLAHDTASTLAAARELSARAAVRICSSRFPAPGGSARHRRSDLRWHSDQRDAAVLTRAISGGGRGVSARHRAAHRRRAQSERRLGRVGIRQPLGHRRRGQGAGRAAQSSSASPSPSEPTRRIARCSARRAGSAFTMPAPARSGCCGPAPAPRIQLLPTSCISKALAAPFTVNTMPEETLKALAEHGELGCDPAGRWRRLRRGAGGVGQSRCEGRCPGCSTSG